MYVPCRLECREKSTKISKTRFKESADSGPDGVEEESDSVDWHLKIGRIVMAVQQPYRFYVQVLRTYSTVPPSTS